MINSSIKPTFENTLYLGFFVAAGTLVVGGRKTLSMIPKAFGKLPDGIFSGTISAGILAGTATAVSYKLSPIAAKKELPFPGQANAVGNRAFAMMVSTFALTLFAIRYTNGKLGSHAMSRSGALAYASIATITSIWTVARDEEDGDFFRYGRKTYMYYTTPARKRPPIDVSGVNSFWKELPSGHSPAQWIEIKIDSCLSGADLQKTADMIEGYEGGTQVAEIFNELYKRSSAVSSTLAKLFALISKDKQPSQDALDSGFQAALKKYERTQSGYSYSSSHVEMKHMSWEDALAAGIHAGVVTTVVTAVTTLALATLRSAVHSPLFNRPLTAALSVATIGAFAVHTVQKVEHDLSKAKKMLLPSTAMLAAGTLLTPTISKFVLKNRISYKAAFGYSLPAALLNLAVEWRREENNWRTVNYD